jgi:hypothetical protein
VYIFLRLCLLIEATGICAGAWFMAAIHKKVSGFQLDEVYVGTPEMRAAGEKPDHSIHPGREFTMGTNVLNNVPANWEEALANLGPAAESYSKRRERILSNIKNMKELTNDATKDEEKTAYETGIKYEIQAMEKLNQEEQETLSDVVVEPKDGDIESA